MLANGISTSAFVARDLGDLLVRHARLPRHRLRVDGEDDCHHPPLAVVLGQLDGGRPGRLAAEVPHRRLTQVVGKRVLPCRRHLDVRVDVDRDGVLEGDGRRRPASGGASLWPMPSEISRAVRETAGP